MDEVMEGRSLISRAEHSMTRDNSIVVKVRVTQMFHDPHTLVHDETAYVSLPRGVNALNPDRTISGQDPNPSVKELRQELHRGLRVLVIAGPQDRDLPLKSPAVLSR